MKTGSGYNADVKIVSDEEDFAKKAVDIFVAGAQKAIREKGQFFVAISGGHTPTLFFESLGVSEKSQALAWDKIQLFWVDERIVPQDSQWSNYKLAADTFLGKVSLPKENIHFISTDNSDFEMSARNYEKQLREVFALEEGQLPQFDLIILGMGAEGHTGSLYPDSYANFDTKDMACVVYILDEKFNRITLTHPVLCAAAHLVVLVCGEEKAEVFREVLTSEPDEVRFPIHVLWPVLDKVTWLADSKAAKYLVHSKA